MSLSATHFILIYHHHRYGHICAPPANPIPVTITQTAGASGQVRRCWTLDLPKYLIISAGYFGSLLFITAYSIIWMVNIWLVHVLRNTIKKSSFCSNHFVLIVGWYLRLDYAEPDKCEGKWRHNIGPYPSWWGAAWVWRGLHTVFV